MTFFTSVHVRVSTTDDWMRGWSPYWLPRGSPSSGPVITAFLLACAAAWVESVAWCVCSVMLSIPWRPWRLL